MCCLFVVFTSSNSLLLQALNSGVVFSFRQLEYVDGTEMVPMTVAAKKKCCQLFEHSRAHSEYADANTVHNASKYL